MGKTVKISKEVQFDSGHRVPKHESKCQNPHGHRYRLVAECTGTIVEDPEAPDNGMLVDFGILKKWLMEIHDELDHGFIVWEEDRNLLIALATANSYHPQPGAVAEDGWKIIEFPYVPTAENIAKWAFEYLEPIVIRHFRHNLVLDAIIVWETPTSMARFGRS